MGDRPADVSIVPNMQAGSPAASLVEYWDHFYRGNFAPGHQATREAQLAGSTSNGSAGSITDATKNWWVDHSNGGGSPTTATGTLSNISSGSPGSAIANVPAPTGGPYAATWAVTADPGGSPVLTGTYTFPSAGAGRDAAYLTGDFTEDMDGYTVTFTFPYVLHAETGTATGGSATTLIDTTKDTTVKPLACWWDPTRFPNGPYVGFVLEVTRATGSGSGTKVLNWRVPITNASSGASGVTLTFPALAGLAVQAGDTYEIREPAYERDKWKGRTLSLINKFGTRYATIVTHSDDVTLFFDQAVVRSGNVTAADDGSDSTPAAGWTYTINEPRTGGVYEWVANSSGGTFNTSAGSVNDPTAIFLDAGAWVPARGADDVRLGVTTPADFRFNITGNLETYVVDYGTVRRDDVPVRQTFRELYWTINALFKTPQGASWLGKPSLTGTEEKNTKTGSSGSTWKELNYAEEPNVHVYPWVPEEGDPPFGYIDYPDVYPFDKAKEEAQGRYGETMALSSSDYDDAVGATGTLPDPSPYNDGAVPTATGDAVAPHGYATTICGGCTNASYVVSFNSTYAYPVVQGVATAFPATVAFWAFAKGPGDTKDGTSTYSYVQYNGSSPGTTVPVNDRDLFTGAPQDLQYWKWSVVATGAIGSDGTYVGGKVGGNAPDAVKLPPTPLVVSGSSYNGGITNGINAGYRVTDQAAILTWQLDYMGAYHA
jgi:hypothetical protein